MASSEVVTVVKAAILAELSPAVVAFRDVDSPETLERPDGDEPFLEIEFVGGRDAPVDFGSPDNNTWIEEGTVLFHIFVSHKADMSVARAIWSAIHGVFVGRLRDGVFFEHADGGSEHPDAEGGFKGASRAVFYSYEHNH